jgi:hypothetical protein
MAAYSRCVTTLYEEDGMNNPKNPRWIFAYAIFQLLLAVAFGIMAYVNRGFQFPELVGNADATFSVGLFANRNLGVVGALVAVLTSPCKRTTF